MVELIYTFLIAYVVLVFAAFALLAWLIADLVIDYYSRKKIAKKNHVLTKDIYHIANEYTKK